jgi:transglutaminase-like putative cysteine protease
LHRGLPHRDFWKKRKIASVERGTRPRCATPDAWESAVTKIDRRRMLQCSAAVSIFSVLPGRASAATGFAPAPGAWRNFEVVTRLEIARSGGPAQAWVPLPAFDAPEWFRPAGSTWTGNAANAEIKRDAKYGASFLHAAWKTDEKVPVVEVTSRFATRDRKVDLAKPGTVAGLSAAERALFTAGTELIPTDGIVAETAAKITRGAASDLDKARRLYEWVVENTFRDPKTRGCGLGDVGTLLKSGNLGGKCADLNALYVGLARASGLPARDVYGLRIGPSAFGYKSPGPSTEIVTKAQHCRAEVFLAGFGWVPVDPADVRKVALEEPPGNLALADAKVADARAALFGAWEMNWLAYNVAHDVALPGSKGPPVGFLMYPQCDIGGERIDCLDPDAFRYKITAREIKA